MQMCLLIFTGAVPIKAEQFIRSSLLLQNQRTECRPRKGQQ